MPTAGNRVLQRATVTTSGSTSATDTIYFDGYTETAINGGTTSTIKYYAANGQRIAMKQGTTLTYLVSDLLGNSTLALKSDGTLFSAQLFSPFGSVRYSDSTMPNSFSFTGQRLDSQTGLLYYSFRYYDPVSGRFTRTDTQETNAVGMDTYGYVHGNPETMCDPTGHRIASEDPSGDFINQLITNGMDLYRIIAILTTLIVNTYGGHPGAGAGPQMPEVQQPQAQQQPQGGNPVGDPPDDGKGAGDPRETPTPTVTPTPLPGSPDGKVAPNRKRPRPLNQVLNPDGKGISWKYQATTLPLTRTNSDGSLQMLDNTGNYVPFDDNGYSPNYPGASRYGWYIVAGVIVGGCIIIIAPEITIPVLIVGGGKMALNGN